MKNKKRNAPVKARLGRAPKLHTKRAKLTQSRGRTTDVEVRKNSVPASSIETDAKAVVLPVVSTETTSTVTNPLEPMRAYESLAADPIRLYMREIGEVPLLTLVEETKLAKRIMRGDAAAREHMIKANLRLVVKIARDYENYGLPLLDLISEGNIGLMKAVERFDPDKGAKLSTYAAWWIKQAIKRALADQGKTIRLPVHVVDKLFHIRKTEAKLVELLGREPTDAEIAEETELRPDQVRDYRKASIAPTSLDAKLGDDDTNRVADIVADPNAEAPYQQVISESDNEILSEVIRTLTPREQTILTLRFGLNGDDERTLEQVGEQFGVTRERIRQIQDEALRKLRKRIQQRDRKQDEIAQAV
jgi:RNA polymerase primary sigma factor